MSEPGLTERQRKWFASVRDGLQRDTGKSLEEWVAIARTCPETRPRARLQWFKETHGLLQNRASYVLDQAFGGAMAWDQPDALVASLWSKAAARGIYDAIDAAAMALQGSLRTPRKGYTAWARTFQFAAAKPVKGGVLLGLALPQVSEPRLQPRPASPSWSERLQSQLHLTDAAEVDNGVAALLRAAWENS